MPDRLPQLTIHRYLALICLMKADCEKVKGLIDYDVNVIQGALSKVFGYEE